MNLMLDDFLFFVRADAPWKSLGDFIKDAKSKPAKSMAFSAGGTPDTMAVTRAFEGDHAVQHRELQ